MAANMSTSDFEATIGVNANPNPDLLGQLQYMGVNSIRAWLPGGTDAATLAPYLTLAAAGIKFNILAAEGGSSPSMADVKAQLDALEAAAPGCIASVEGPNEPNIWPISYAGQSGTAAAVAYQQDLYNTVHSDPALAGVQVYDFAFGGVGPDTYAQAGDQTASVDATNIHVYPDGLGNGAPAPEIVNEHDLAKVSAPAKPMVMTEFGYSTHPGGDIDQAAQARFTLDALLDQPQLGLSKTFIYDIQDSGTGSPDEQLNYGLFQTDGTPKEAATALHNLAAILADSGSGANLPDVQAPTISGLPNSANTLTLEKSDGTLDVAVWDEGGNPSDQMSLSLPAASDVSVYDPLQGTSAQQTFSATTSATISVGADPLIVEIKGNGQGSNPAPSAPPAPASPSPPPSAAPTPSLPTPTPAPQPPPAAPPASTTNPATVTVGLAEDAWRGNAKASIKVDGNTIGRPTVKMLQSSGQYQAYSYQPQLAAGDHTLTVTFTNDAWGGTPQTDRNLYVDHVDINGASYPAGLPAELYRTGDTLTVPFHTA